MARRHSANKRRVSADSRYQNMMVARLIKLIMKQGKKSTAERIVYDALEQMREQSKADPIEVLGKALDNVKPKVEVKSRRVGGATYQVPVEVSLPRQESLAMRWIVMYSLQRKGAPMNRALALEVLDAYKNQGNAIKKREEMHKMAQANKAFAHYRW